MMKAKKIFFTSLLSLLFFHFLKSQTNLVPNPSFESYTYCPTSIGDMPALNNWSMYGGTPDYYNTCATGASTPAVGVPSNWLGYQNAFNGIGYVGIITYDAPGNREHAGVQLTQTLSIGTKYYVSAYISRSDTSPCICSTNKFGFRFSTNPYSNANPVPIDNFSHIHSNLIINDSLGWTQVSGSFVADSAYKFFMLGNFYDNSNTSLAQCGHPLATAYYFVDKVCVSTDSTTCDISTVISEKDINNNIVVYPNPSSDFVNIHLPLFLKNGEIFIYDSFGQEFSKKDLTGSNSIIEISNLNSGIFFLRLSINNKIYNYKLIKQKL